MEKVIFDTNFIRNTEAKHFLGGRSDLEKFAKVAELVFPDIVIEEIKNQKKRSLLSKKQSFLDNPFHWLRNLNKNDTNDFDIDAHVNHLEGNEEIKYSIIHLTDGDAALRNMKQLALAYNPPFAKINKDDKKNTDKGFKDAYIYLTIQEYLQEVSIKRVFVCTNDGRLKEALEKEPNIIVVKNYEEFKANTIGDYQTDYFIEKLQSEVYADIGKDHIVDYWFNANENQVLFIEVGGEKYTVEVDSGEIVAFENVATYSGLIDQLINSGTFATTHSAIEVLNPYIHYLSDDEIFKIFQACIDNSQIRQIMIDDDVKQFVSMLYEKKKELLSSEQAADIKNRLEA